MGTPSVGAFYCILSAVHVLVLGGPEEQSPVVDLRWCGAGRSGVVDRGEHHTPL